MGSDSLGTVTKQVLDPDDLTEYFELGNGFKIKTGPDGQPLLDEWTKILHKTHTVPSNYYTNVEKIFPLNNLEMGVMCSGIAALGDRSIKNLIWEFNSLEEVIELRNSDYTLNSVGEKLLNFLWEHYSRIFPETSSRPDLELMLCGYDRKKYTPGMIRIHVQNRKVYETDYDFCVFFGGQTKEIQRLVFGTDMFNKVKLIDRSKELLNQYHDLLAKDLESRGIQVQLNKPDEYGQELDLFKGWRLEGLASNWGAFSEQTAVECIDFLVNIMIRSHEFSTQIPSVGGEVQIAIIKKISGFQYISKREWRHGDYRVPKLS